ncbi:hypothetical protein [Porphyromonas somerae]|uniref:hypothetical protein n=1 Tax=Porphyromonas somerae TaxID=322095 RepID=UPI002A80AB45|nr:hypothetical protein [Porphyromonas somerae]MDY3884423.1 hypothetical protein [Porphyromonas somerae]
MSECLFFSCINLIFRMRAEWIPQGYGIRSARIRNMGAMWCGIPESVHTPHPLFLKFNDPSAGVLPYRHTYECPTVRPL